MSARSGSVRTSAEAVLRELARAVAALAVVAGLLAVPAPAPAHAQAQADTHCPPGQSPQFSAGFAALSERLLDWMGTPITCELPDPRGTGDVHQQTTRGLAFWRKSTNVPTFTNGSEHWALGPRGFVYWQGSSVDPPADAVPGRLNPASAFGQPPPSDGPAPPVADARPAGPALEGRQPDTCEWTLMDPRVRAFWCQYPGGTEAWWRSSQLPGVLYAVVEPDGRATVTEDGRRALGLPVAPNGASLPAVDLPAASGTFPCLKENPACGREPWWAEWNERQETAYVTYRGIGTGFITQARFREAVGLLAQWPEGQTLLRKANGLGVLVVASSTDGEEAFASYQRLFHLVTVNARFVEVSTWMLADVLAHELRHVADHADGVPPPQSEAACYASEQAAYEVERRYLQWLVGDLVKQSFPSPNELGARIAELDAARRR